jgi:hypothetical protein
VAKSSMAAQPASEIEAAIAINRAVLVRIIAPSLLVGPAQLRPAVG